MTVVQVPIQDQTTAVMVVPGLTQDQTTAVTAVIVAVAVVAVAVIVEVTQVHLQIMVLHCLTLMHKVLQRALFQNQDVTLEADTTLMGTGTSQYIMKMVKL